MKIVAGLGNPGVEYAWSRHNAGWLVLDSFITALSLGEPRLQFSGAFWPASIVCGERVAFLKPHTYMNLSGTSVGAAAKYFDVDPQDVLVVFDDVSIPFGTLRWRDGGSAGGQNGMKSVIASLGTLDVPRLRIGVGGPQPQVDMKDWVLGKFTREQRDQWHLIEALALDALKKWLSGSAGEGFTLRVQKGEGGQA